MLTRELGVHAGGGHDRDAACRRSATSSTRLRVRPHRRRASSTAPGLSHDDRLGCATLLAVARASTRSHGSRAVADGLAIAGKRGTLALSLRGTPLEGNLRAKTGTLAGVSGLAGYVRSDRPLTFALLLDGRLRREHRDTHCARPMATDIAAYPAVTGRARHSSPLRLPPIPARACRGAEGAC